MKQRLVSKNQSDNTLRSELCIKEKLIEDLKNKNEVRMYMYIN